MSHFLDTMLSMLRRFLSFLISLLIALVIEFLFDRSFLSETFQARVSRDFSS